MIKNKIYRAYKCPVCGLYSQFEKFHGDYGIRIKIIKFGGKIRGTGKGTGAGKGKAMGKIEWISDSDIDKIKVGNRLLNILHKKFKSISKKITLLEANSNGKKTKNQNKKGKNKTKKND